MAQEIRTDRGAVHRRRNAVVEPVNGQFKCAQGFVQFHVRGLCGVSGEWSLVTMCHNMAQALSLGIRV